MLTLGLSLVGCASPKPIPRHPMAQAVDPSAPISDEAFASALVDYLLMEPKTRAQQKRAPALVGRQIARSAERFAARETTSATSTFLGALLLLRLNDLDPAALGPHAAAALRPLAREYAKRGAEGQARAAYALLEGLGEKADRERARAHLSALDNWQQLQERSLGPVSKAALRAEQAMQEHLLRLDERSRQNAERELGSWVGEASALRDTYRGDARTPARHEVSEAVRAFTLAPLMLAGLYLRSADPAGALRALARTRMKPMMRPELLGLIDEVVDRPSVESWFRLASALRQGVQDSDGELLEEELMVLHLSAFVAAVEAYRAAPIDIHVAALLALCLRDYGMDEAVAFVVYPAVKAQPSARNLSIALRLGVDAMGNHLELDEQPAARRVYQGMAPIIALAEQAREPLSPGPARLWAMMGHLELSNGQLESAFALLSRAAKSEPSPLLEQWLAKIEHHKGDLTSALGRIGRAVGETSDPVAQAELRLLEGDVLRSAARLEEANAAYLAAARLLFPDEQSQLSRAELDRLGRERVLADLYDRYERTEQAEQALVRATTAAGQDPHRLTAVIGHRAARALRMRDAAAARSAIERALALEVGGAQMIYPTAWALWLAPESREGERWLSQWTSSPHWSGRIAELGLGKRDAESLLAVAKSPAERCEAFFYAGLARERSGDRSGARTAYERAVATGALVLVEYELAREKLRPPPVLAASEELDRIDGTARERELALEAARAAAEAAQKKKPRGRRR